MSCRTRSDGTLVLQVQEKMTNSKFRRNLNIAITLIVLDAAGLAVLFTQGLWKNAPSPAKTAAAETAAAEPSASPVPAVSTAPSPSASAAAQASQETLDLDSDDSIYRIISSAYPVEQSYVPQNLVEPDVNMNHTQQVREELAEPLKQLFAAAEKAGISLKLVSGYRSYQLQVSLMNTYTERYGAEFARRIDDHPGASEHQLGLAVDLGDESGKCELSECFVQTSASQWLEDHAYEYGFIERYPEGKESVTGIMYSPWHYRYVGTEQAEKIHASGLSMEEYYNRKS
jgi:D-alanyl-D-alanine carboxypeptidase